MGLCLSLISNSTQAEDAAQEIFIKAYQSLSRFRGDSSFSTWLYRIAANHCRDLLRKKTREHSESWNDLMERYGESLEKMLVGSNPPFSRDDADLAHRILSLLSPEYRLILSLREGQGLSYQEIAQTLECTLDAVKARLRRARCELQEKLRHF